MIGSWCDECKYIRYSWQHNNNIKKNKSKYYRVYKSTDEDYSSVRYCSKNLKIMCEDFDPVVVHNMYR